MLDENTKNINSGEHWKVYFLPKPKLKLTGMTFNENEEEILNKETIANGFGQFFSSIAITLLQTLYL